MSARIDLVNQLAPEVEKAYQHLAPGSRCAAIAYRASVENLGNEGGDREMLEAGLLSALSARRDAELERGMCLVGPHRGDLVVGYMQKGRAAAESSTGEQKALILNLVLAQAARLSRVETEPDPILLLDEVAAHLDPRRRSALFDEIEALDLQAFLTGTDQTLFFDLKGRAQGVFVDAGSLLTDDP